MRLGGRLAATFAALVAATALLIGAVSVLTTQRQVNAEVDQFLEQRSSQIARGQRPRPEGRQDGRRSDRRVDVAVEPDAEVQLVDARGRITANSGLTLPVDGRDVAIADDGRSTVLRTVTVDDAEYRMITQPVSGGGAVQVARALDESAALVDILRTRLLLIAIVMATIAAGVGWVLSQRITRPLRSLTTAVDSVATTRDFTVPVEAVGSDEVGRLAAGFDRMLRALDVSRRQQHRLVQDAAHELRTPLTSITANVDWLARADVEAAVRTQALDGVRTELAELNDLIDEIVDLATDRHQLAPFAPLDLADVARDAVAQLSDRTDRPVDAHLASVRVEGDPESLHRAVANLLANADKYSPPGEPVTVRVDADGLTVADRGPGIPADERDRVLDRFYRLPEHRALPGSGLGLSIVVSIVEAHHGTVSITEREGGGARVGFRLPVVDLPRRESDGGLGRDPGNRGRDT